MCGIGGILRTDGAPIPDAWLDMIDARIAARGPDGAGRFADRVDADAAGPAVQVGFVHRRLCIIDPATGHQPMVGAARNGDGRLAVVFNGCIYNHRALRAELQALGHAFVTDHSDTEVLLHGYRAWGEDLPARLEGMFAFAIWDRARRSLFLARDPFGEKPLYVRETGHIVAFASEPRCLALEGLAGAETSAADDRRWLRELLRWGYVRSDGPGVRLLPAGFATVIRPAERRRTPGTGAVAPAPLPALDAPPTAEDVETRLAEAVAARLEADVPLGCFLSGGVDSSLVAAFALHDVPELATFCVRMPDPRYDESRFAAEVARYLGTRHVTLDAQARPADDLVHLVDRLGQPFGDSSILPTYWVSAAAREHVAVALSGDGGDELFLGYERYRAARTVARLRPLFALLPESLAVGAHPKTLRFRLGRLGAMARDGRAMGIRAMEAIFSERQLDALLGPDPEAAAPATAHRSGDPDALAALRRWDLEHYLPDDLLRKVDTASMAVALEVRCPFLDRRLASTALALPLRVLSPPGTRKGLLRSIARRHLPATVVDRPKMGFAVPLGEWFRDDHGGMRSLLTDVLGATAPFGPFALEGSVVRRMLDEHLAGRRDHAHRLFTLLTLALWVRGDANPNR
jgi:asparagine synthase (glutamine-hydrolysing)